MEDRKLTRDEIALSVLNGLIAGMPRENHPFWNYAKANENQKEAVAIAFNVAGWFTTHREMLDRNKEQ